MRMDLFQPYLGHVDLHAAIKLFSLSPDYERASALTNSLCKGHLSIGQPAQSTTFSVHETNLKLSSSS